MDIIDFHAHIYPEKIAEKAVRSVGDFYGIGISRGGTAADLLEDVAVVPEYVRTINNFLSAAAAAHTELIGFGTLHPDMDDPLAESGRIESLGLRGVKIHPDTQKFPIDDEKMLPVYAALEGRLPILIHCGDYRYDYSHPRRLARVLEMFPDLTVVAAHFGGWSVFDLALEYLLDKRCYLDVSSSIMMLGHKRAAELIRAYGAKRILFGSDFPMWSPAQELETFLSLGLTEEENRLILCENAKRILKG